MSEAKVVLVGHCGADTSLLRWMVERTLGSVPVVSVHDQPGLEAQATDGSVLLVNRVLDGRFAAAGGVDLIKAMAPARPKVAMLLISDYPEAQAAAEAGGARPGFGKSQVNDPEAAQRLRQAWKP